MAFKNLQFPIRSMAATAIRVGLAMAGALFLAAGVFLDANALDSSLDGSKASIASSDTAGVSQPANPAIAIDVDSLLASLDPLPADSIRIHPLGSGSFSTAVLIRLGPHARVPGHVHREHDEVIHLLRGSARMRAGSRLIAMRPGSVVMVPRGLPHGAEAGPEGCAVVSIYAPVWDPKDRHRDPRGDP